MSEVKGERGRDKPRMKWMDGMKKHVSETCKGWIDIQGTLKNRVEWRVFSANWYLKKGD